VNHRAAPAEGLPGAVSARPNRFFPEVVSQENLSCALLDAIRSNRNLFFDDVKRMTIEPDRTRSVFMHWHAKDPHKLN
jgi:hypothetical protein